MLYRRNHRLAHHPRLHPFTKEVSSLVNTTTEYMRSVQARHCSRYKRLATLCSVLCARYALYHTVQDAPATDVSLWPDLKTLALPTMASLP